MPSQSRLARLPARWPAPTKYGWQQGSCSGPSFSKTTLACWGTAQRVQASIEADTARPHCSSLGFKIRRTMPAISQRSSFPGHGSEVLVSIEEITNGGSRRSPTVAQETAWNFLAYITVLCLTILQAIALRTCSYPGCYRRGRPPP